MSRKVVCVERGNSGFGGPLFLKKDGKKNKIVSMTGSGIVPVAEKLGKMLDAEVVDGFKKSVDSSEMIAVIIDCGGTARCGVYPKQGIPTINTNPVGKSGPLAKYITADIYVSDVGVDDLSYAYDKNINEMSSKPLPLDVAAETETDIDPIQTLDKKKNKENLIAKMGRVVGGVVSKFYAAGRESVDVVIRNILPFMAFVSVIVGIINGTGIGEKVANWVAPKVGSFGGMILLSIFCSIPFLSPVLGPGAAIASLAGMIIGQQIGAGNIPPQFALPALFAINAQVGCDFIPVGLSLAEADARTIEIGTPAVLFSRVITGPLAVVIAYLLSFGLYS